jgi:hypothetical protein
MSLLFAATYPERVTSLVLYGTFARGTANAAHEGAASGEHLEKLLDRISHHWGDGTTLVSSTVRDLVVGSEIGFSDRGVHQLKGAPGDWQVLAVIDSASTSMVGRRTEPEPRGRQERALLAVARHAPWLARRQARRALGREPIE